MYQTEEKTLEINMELKSNELLKMLYHEERQIVHHNFPNINIRQYEQLNSNFLPNAAFSGIRSKLIKSQINLEITVQEARQTEISEKQSSYHKTRPFEMKKNYETYKGFEQQHASAYSGHFNKNSYKPKYFRKNRYDLNPKQIAFEYKNVVVSLKDLKLGPKFSNPNIKVQALQNFRRLYVYLTEVSTERLAIENVVLPNNNVQINGYIPQTRASNFKDHLEYTFKCIAFELRQIKSVFLCKRIIDLCIEKSVIDICPNLIMKLGQHLVNLKTYESGATSGTAHLDFLNHILLSLIHDVRYLGVYLFVLKLIINSKASDPENCRNIYIGS